MPGILLTNYYTPEVLTLVRKVLPKGFSLIFLSKPGKEEIISKAKEASYILAGGRTKIDDSVLDAAPNLKMIQRSGVGTDTLDFEALKQRNIPVYVNPGVNSSSVAEHSIMLILSALRNLPKVHNIVASGIWKKHELGVFNHELAGKTVGLIGLGHIGKKVAEMLRPFGVRLLYNKREQLSDEEETRLSIRFSLLDELFEQSDIISLHCALNSSTQAIINSETIAKMKSGVILINTSRGKLIDEKALIENLQSGKISFAGLDVYESEPLSPDSDLIHLPNVILTPHISGITYESFIGMMTAAFSNIQSFERGDYSSIEDKKVQMK